MKLTEKIVEQAVSDVRSSRKERLLDQVKKVKDASWLLLEAADKIRNIGELERLLEIERSAEGLIKVMKEYPLNREWWWKYREALEQALEKHK